MTLTDIIGYLPHGSVGVSDSGDIAPIDIYTLARHGIKLDGHKPVLRPMDDLDTEITEKRYNDGKPFVPIVELAKVSWHDVASIINEHGMCVFTSFGGEKYDFSWVQDSRYFRTLKQERGMFICPALTFSQSDLFDLLHAWHFDYRGLIERGDVVNIYDLETNPYK